MSSRQLQETLIKTLYEINNGEFSFEEAANPTIPGCVVIFEFGLADGETFSFIDKEEVEKLLTLIEGEHLDTLDFFCAIRYYKVNSAKRTPLKFDYYIVRTIYGRDIVEAQVYHKKGLRYVSPEDLMLFIVNKINDAAKKKVLRKQTSTLK